MTEKILVKFSCSFFVHKSDLKSKYCPDWIGMDADLFMAGDVIAGMHSKMVHFCMSELNDIHIKGDTGEVVDAGMLLKAERNLQYAKEMRESSEVLSLNTGEQKNGNERIAS